MRNKNTAPPSKRYTPEQIITIARKVGIPENLIPEFVAISIAENRTGETLAQGDLELMDDKWGPSVGLMQIRSLKNPLTPGYTKADNLRYEKKLTDPEYNLRTAYEIYKEKGFKPWSTYNLDKETKVRAYEEFLPEVKRLVLRTKPTMGPDRSRMETNILSGGGGMSKPISSRVPTEFDDITFELGGKFYNAGDAVDLFTNSSDQKTLNEIVSIVKQYSPNGRFETSKSVNSVWNEISQGYTSSFGNHKKPFDVWLEETIIAKREALGTSDGPSVFLQPSITPKDQAYQDFNTFILDATGIAANPADAAQYYKELSKLEKSKVAKQVTTRSGSTTTQTATAGVTKEDREILAAKFVDRYIDTAGVKNVGGIVGSNLASIRKLASDYNVTLSDAEVRKFAIDGLSNKNSLEIAKTKIQNTSKVRYQNLAQYIDQGLTVKDIASQYINKMANVLEINPDTIKLDDRYIDSALSNLPNFTDFNKTLRSSPQWEYTTNAREEAAGYANKILQDFGLR
jgi:hypothetical protein